MNENDLELMRVSDAAEALGITPRQIYEAIDRGELPAENRGEGIRIRTLGQ